MSIAAPPQVPPQTAGWETQNVVAGGDVVWCGALAAARLVDPRFLGRTDHLTQFAPIYYNIH